MMPKWQLFAQCGVFAALLLSPPRTSAVTPDELRLAAIPAGSFEPFYADPVKSGSPPLSKKRTPARVSVHAFLLDPYPVTKARFLDFVTAHPQWRRSEAKRLFADAGYLRSWNSDLEFSGDPEQPVTEVSWFAAKAFCKAQDERLPTTSEWEFTARADETKADATGDERYLSRILDWYGRREAATPLVGVWRNVYGVYDLHGLIWEWVADFNSALITSESRQDSGSERDLFCGGGSTFASEKQKRDYAAFMRYAFRSSLEGTFALPQLGFRCAKDLPLHRRKK
ncbi:MAG: formylglycine-generating enzyme family protein [Bdellovibrionota bacterium]